MIQPNDAFNVLKKIPGTGAYWKDFRNKIFAKLEQLGPFHLFYTLSCAGTLGFKYVIFIEVKI